MTPFALTIFLAWRDPARNVALFVAILAVLIFIVGVPGAGQYWVALLVGPAFLISIALSLPTFSPFERAMPLTVSQLLWSRILSSLGPVWLSLLLGVVLIVWTRQPLSAALTPVECATFFTVSVCLATLARLASSARNERILAFGALVSAVLALLLLTPVAALFLAGAAVAPVAARYWWTNVPDLSWPRALTLTQFFWPPLRLIWSRWVFVIVPITLWFGLDLSWSLLPFAGLFVKLDTLPHRYTLTLPVPRRQILWALLLPIIVPYVIGVAFSGLFDPTDRIINSAHPPGQTALRDYYGNPPGLLVPRYYWRTSATPTPAKVAAPWGETAQPRAVPIDLVSGTSKFIYDPYWVDVASSDRFFEWQFARATREIYGRQLRPQELSAAIRGGLKPITDQPRMLIIRALCGTAFLLTLGLLSEMSDWWRLRRIPRIVRSLMPFWAPVLGLVGLQVYLPRSLTDIVTGWLLHLSAALPGNLILMTLLLLAAMAPIYWALDTVFSQMEFPDKPKETA